MKSDQNTIISLEKGKLPPQAVDVEEIVLGALMIDERSIEDVVERLKPEHFYKDENQKIYSAIFTLIKEEKPVDLLTVSAQLKKDKNLNAVGGEFRLIQLTQKVSSSAHTEYHSHIIIQKSIQRQMIKHSNDLIEEAYGETDVFDLLEKGYDVLNKISSMKVTSKEETPKDLLKTVIQKGVDIKSGKVKPGIATPIKNFTKKTGGWRDGELIIIAARPGMGKTAFALLCAYEPAKQGIPTAFFSLEIKKEGLVARIASMEAEVDGNKFNAWGLDPEDLEKIKAASETINSAQIHIDDSDNGTIHELRLKLKRMIKEHGIRLAVIDYLQLMSGTGNNREQEISQISRGLKKLAMELSIPIIALSQLSRAVETRGGSKRPMLSDLRESGAIEQDADMVSFLYRPEYYRLSEWDDYDGISCIGEAEYIVAKNRNGGLVRNRMKFDAKYTKFSDIIESENEAFDFTEENKDDIPF